MRTVGRAMGAQTALRMEMLRREGVVILRWKFDGRKWRLFSQSESYWKAK